MIHALKFIAFYISIPLAIGCGGLLIEWAHAWQLAAYVAVGGLGFLLGRYGNAILRS